MTRRYVIETALLVAACVAIVYGLAGCTPTVVSGCPYLKTYTLEQQRKGAEALSKLYQTDPQSPLLAPLTEWASLRQQVKDCQKDM